MDAWNRLLAFISGRTSSIPLPTRRERREAARERHRETAEPAWTTEDRHLGPAGERWVADVSEGTPGHFGSVDSVKDD